MRRSIRMSNPRRKFCKSTEKITFEKYAIKIHPVIAPIDIAENVCNGLIPISLPMMDPTSPPDPWNGIITKRIIPTNSRGLIQAYFDEDFLPMFSTFEIKRPTKGISLAKS